MLFLFCANILYAQTDSLKVSAEKTGWQKTGKVLSIAVPAAMVTYGLISLDDNGFRQLDYNIHNSIVDKNAFWNTRADDYLQFSPVIAAFGMKLCGVESTHNLTDMAILYTLSKILEGGIVGATKRITGRERPDASNNHSFPSGHTSTAFVAAEFLHQEYKDKSIWISIGGYTVASFVGVARIYNNKHWLSDVVTGAGIGILSTKAVYWAYPYIQNVFCPKNTDGKAKNMNQALFFPSYSQRYLSLNFSYSF